MGSNTPISSAFTSHRCSQGLRCGEAGPATMRPFEASFFDYVRVDDGRIVERIRQADVLGQCASSTVKRWVSSASAPCSGACDQEANGEGGRRHARMENATIRPRQRRSGRSRRPRPAIFTVSMSSALRSSPVLAAACCVRDRRWTSGWIAWPAAIRWQSSVRACEGVHLLCVAQRGAGPQQPRGLAHRRGPGSRSG